MSPETTTQRTVSHLLLPGSELIRAPKGKSLLVTITVLDEGETRDALLRDVGRPGWPHQANP